MSVLEMAIGLLAPPTCVACGEEGSALCVACSEAEIIPYGQRCWRCGALSQRSKTCEKCKSTGSSRFVWLTTDYENTAKQLISAYKYGHLRAASEPIAHLMVGTLISQNNDEQIHGSEYLIVPVPTASSRIRERSFDHSKLLAKTISKKLKIEYCNALQRLGQDRQVGSSRSTRINQALASYRVRSNRVKGRNILLVDDVITTGATVTAATKILRTAGARHVDSLIFAKRM